MTDSGSGLGWNATWSMAVGGMVGGGIFATLGVVISVAGSWAWLSFLIAGVIALSGGYSYVRLAEHFGEGGGAFTFLREIDAEGFAGGLSWILIVGYVLTNAVYAFTFGEYVGHVTGLGAWFPRVAAVFVLSAFIALNLRGAGEAGGIEIFLVWIKLLILLGLAGWGIYEWRPDLLSSGVPESSAGSALLGAATVFMAYEGFQLLAYDYAEIERPQKILPSAVLSAIVVVIVVYIAVTVGTAMLVGAESIVRQQEVALSIAGREVLGTTGVVIVTIGAAFSTGSAINSTLFATARLTRAVAEDGELPAVFDERNSRDVPGRAVLILGAAAALLAVVGSLSSLVEAASLAFLFTFCVVSVIAFRERAGSRLITAFAAVSSGGAIIALVVRLVRESPLSLLFLTGLVLIAAFVRPVILRKVPTE